MNPLFWRGEEDDFPFRRGKAQSPPPLTDVRIVSFPISLCRYDRRLEYPVIRSMTSLPGRRVILVPLLSLERGVEQLELIDRGSEGLHLSFDERDADLLPPPRIEVLSPPPHLFS